MSNFTVNFSVSPWLLLLIIPITVLTFIPYFRMNKRYRRNRNRIISIVLHLIITVLAVSVLSGVSFAYDNQNKENEIMVLVDCSDSLSVSDEFRDNQLQNILLASRSRFKIGVITFGKDQFYVAEPSNDTREIYDLYLRSLEENPVDGRATDIAAALLFAQDKFSNPNTAKIVILSDGFQTDGNALSAIKTVSELGISVDAVQLNRNSQDEVAITNVVLPDQNFKYGDPFDIQITIQSSIDRPNLGLEIYENDILMTSDNANGEAGMDIPQDSIHKGIPYTFNASNYVFVKDDSTDTSNDIRELCFRIIDRSKKSDTYEDNNFYYTYVYIQNFNKVLMLESIEGEADKIQQILTEAEDPFDVTTYNINKISNYPEFPDSLEDLSEFDQIILVNISNADLLDTVGLPSDFDIMLNQYAKEIGGSVFVVGGSEAGTADTENPIAHAFNREDFELAKESGHTSYADMLPVEVTEYRPPLGVMLVIDCSTSMGTVNNPNDKISYALDAAQLCIDELDPHDYIGIIGFNDLPKSYLPISQVISVKEHAKEIVDKITTGGSGTNISAPLRDAGQALEGVKDIDMRHIIVITDGEPYESLYGTDRGTPYGPIIEGNYERANITLSIIHIGDSNSVNMQTAAEKLGNGNYIPIPTGNVSDILTTVREELAEKIIGEATYTPEPYTPVINEYANRIFVDIDTKNLPQLGGYFGTKVKPTTNVPLAAEYNAPLYAEWKYGKGKVAAFMCSLNGDAWSDKWVTLLPDGSNRVRHEVGKQLLYNIVENLMPTTDITMTDIQVDVIEDNFSTRVNIFSTIAENEYIQIDVVKVNDDTQTSIFSEKLIYESNRTTFLIEEPGTYQVEVRKYDSEGQQYDGSYVRKFRVFSYSKEYNTFIDSQEATIFLESLTEDGNGELLDDGAAVFDKYDTAIHRNIDPTLAFIITAIVLFLLDIAVRKFKFKWPHEIIRDRKERIRLSNGGDKR